MKFSLHNKQLEVFESPARFKVVAAGRRGGKSYLSCVMLLIEGLKDFNEAGYPLKNKDVFYIAPTFQMAKDIMWNLLKDLGKDVIVKTHENTATAELINGRRICLKGSDRYDTLRGVGISFAVMDEFAFMKPEVWDLIIRPTLADVEGSALFIGTPEGKNHFYDLWVDAQKEDWEEWEAFHFNSLDNPMISKKEIEHARNTMSTQAFRQEFEASFTSSGTGSFKEDEIKIAKDFPHEGHVFITVDPAGYDDTIDLTKSAEKKLDETAICVTKVTTHGWFVLDIIHGRWGIRETAVRILRAAQKYQPVALGIEKGTAKNAIMPYLTDEGRRLGIYPNYDDLTHGNKKKTDRIMWALQGRFQHGRITLKEGEWNRALISQLLDFPNPRVHDDLVDALAYIDQISEVSYIAEGVFEQEEGFVLDEESGY
ncbi:MAG: terminase family protein [Candidatus Thorarchaeota archaeon]|jgi:predicted phage terminase large subunit-like protein